MKERRKFPRIYENVKVRYKIIKKEDNTFEDKESIKFAEAANISLKGACLETEEKIEDGTFLSLEIKLPIFPHPIFVVGRVIWGKSFEDRFKVGIKFIKIGEEDSFDIFNYVMEKILRGESKCKKIS